ncbi:uncharacterized protein EAF01_007281 [Botrytis porri]|uniref:Uncharacterized protein n=1 Tax=Botrytis porri TaxID=87229 RepID=A0A4Z1KZB3_9HELO|nr:uncharacterized protein EAF01_007281 [Botrytis porri]KAF7901983.1 hypothetical protein EAF01_007281 [Botrytis porri]TGO89831.1 hypothetical protein BPOR_0092g00170 [Botrytis porri]
MRLTLVASLFLSLATLIIASPYPHQVPETDKNIARGLVHAPRNSRQQSKANSNNVIIITKTEEEQLTEISRNREIQLTKLVQERLIIIDRTQIARDNIRRNHFKSLNSQQNIIIIVVTQIVDARDRSNKSIRYMTHQIQADNEAQDTQFVVVQQDQRMTINGASATGTASLPRGTGTSASPLFETYDPNAIPLISNVTQILPMNAQAPNFAGVKQFQDPAVIIEEGQKAFVNFVSAMGN